MQHIELARLIVTPLARRDALLLLAAGAAAFALGLIFVRRGRLAAHRGPYIRLSGSALLCAGAIFVGAGLVLSGSAAAWLLF